MMDIHPLMSTATDHHHHHHHHQPDLRLYSTFDTTPASPPTQTSHAPSTMIIDATTHNSSMPVSPKQGETINAAKQDSPKLVSSSSWEHLSQKTATTTTSLTSAPSSSPPPPTTTTSTTTNSEMSSADLSSPDNITSSLSAHSWPVPSQSDSLPSPPPPSSSPSSSSTHQTDKTNQKPTDDTTPSCFNSWNAMADKSPQSSLPSLSTSSASSLPGNTPDTATTKEFDDMVRNVPTPTNLSSRNCDQPDSSPSSHSMFNSSFDESDQVRATVPVEGMNSVDNFPSPGVMMNHIDTSYERRSRRKPTIEDIVRRVKPPVDAPPYDSEESDMEDDVINEEMMLKMNRMRENDEVDGTAKQPMRLSAEGFDDEEAYKEQYRQFNMNRLSRLEAVDGIPEDEKEDIDARSDEDFAEAEKRAALYRDIPLAVYNIIHEVKVNAHAMFMKTANFLEPEEAKVRREQYLLQLLSNLRDRCLGEGIKPEVIGEILKDVESEISLINEDLEEMKQMKQFGMDAENDYNNLAASGVHFLSKQESPSDDDNKSNNKSGQNGNNALSYNSPTFLNASSLSSSSPTSPNTSSVTSSMTSGTSPSSRDTKPIITTISADGIVSTVVKDDPNGNGNVNNNNTKGGQQPPPLINGGLPPLYPASNISETAFSPNMFPGNGKMNSWFPGSLLNNMPFYPFNGSGSPLDHALARKFLPFEGKMGDSVDKDYLKCQFCERTFRRQKNLENHIENTHHGKNPLKTRRDTHDMYFKCSHCPYTTKHQSNLYVHLRIHTGERPYMCGACGVQYSQSHSLKSHIINKHDGIMSYYIKEKRTRSPRSGIGYLTSQVMHDNTIFKLPPPPLLAPAMHHHTNLDYVNKAIEMAKSDLAGVHHQHQKMQQQQQQLHQQTSPNHKQQSLKEELSPNGSSMPGGRMPPLPPLTPNNTNIHNPPPTTPPKTPSSSNNSFNPNSPSNPLMSSKNGQGQGNPHPSLFMNGHSGMPPFMFGELPPHLRNPNHPSSHPHPPPHPLFPGLPFPPHSSSGYHTPANPGLSPLQGMSPNSTSGMPNMAPNMPPGMQQMFSNFPHLSPSPISNSQHSHPPHIKKEISPSGYTNSTSSNPNHPSHHQQSDRQGDSARRGTKRQNSGPLPEEAIDLRKRTPSPSSLDAGENSHDHELCYGKENCPHAAKLKYLRLNVVRMLGILVPNLNFAEKGISAESESVDELLQDVIESNVPEEEMMD